MHDVKLLRDDPDALRAGLRRRQQERELGPLLDRAVALDHERRSLVQERDAVKQARNEASQAVARLKRAGEDAAAIIADQRTLGERLPALERHLAAVEEELERILLSLPNVPRPEVPDGGEAQNQVVREWGTPRPADGVRPHWEVGEALGLIDLARGAKIAGSGFVVLRGGGARLTRALMSFMLDLHVTRHGFEEVWVPTLVNRAAMIGTGQLPKFEEDAYAIAGDDLFLIPTAEVPITNLHRDEVLDGEHLPRRLTGYSPCFRREAGAHGKDTRGLIRVHEFDKVEMVCFTTPDESEAELERLTACAEAVLQALELPYRVVLLAAGDTGFASAKTYDLEVWAPGVGKWLEVSSCSTFADFQARRANIRYRPAPGEKPRFVHTLNGSGLAFPRTLIAILEHYQERDGTIAVPAVLRPYLGADRLE